MSSQLSRISGRSLMFSNASSRTSLEAKVENENIKTAMEAINEPIQLPTFTSVRSSFKQSKRLLMKLNLTRLMAKLRAKFSSKKSAEPTHESPCESNVVLLTEVDNASSHGTEVFSSPEILVEHKSTIVEDIYSTEKVEPTKEVVETTMDDFDKTLLVALTEDYLVSVLYLELTLYLELKPTKTSVIKKERRLKPVQPTVTLKPKVLEYCVEEESILAQDMASFFGALNRPDLEVEENAIPIVTDDDDDWTVPKKGSKRGSNRRKQHVATVAQLGTPSMVQEPVKVPKASEKQQAQPKKKRRNKRREWVLNKEKRPVKRGEELSCE